MKRRRQIINLEGATEAEAMRPELDKLKKKKKRLGEAPSVNKILAPVWCVGGRVCIVKTGMSLISPYRDTSLHFPV